MHKIGVIDIRKWTKSFLNKTDHQVKSSVHAGQRPRMMKQLAGEVEIIPVNERCPNSLPGAPNFVEKPADIQTRDSAASSQHALRYSPRIPYFVSISILEGEKEEGPESASRKPRKTRQPFLHCSQSIETDISMKGHLTRSSQSSTHETEGWQITLPDTSLVFRVGYRSDLIEDFKVKLVRQCSQARSRQYGNDIIR